MPPGFTLLEVLVALVVLGLILAGLTQGTQFGLHVARRQTEVIANAGDMDAAERLLRRLIEQMNPGTSTHAPLLAGGPGSLAFTANLAAAAPALGVAEADVSLGVTADHRLVLRWTPHLHATLLGPRRRFRKRRCCPVSPARSSRIGIHRALGSRHGRVRSCRSWSESGWCSSLNSGVIGRISSLNRCADG